MKTLGRYCQMVIALVMLMRVADAQAQLSMGGDVAGGHVWVRSESSDDKLKHTEAKGNLWLAYKTKNYDWHLSLTGKYKNQDSETTTDDVGYEDNKTASYTNTFSTNKEKPLTLTARYDLNWRPSHQGSYSLWTQYGYGHSDYESAFLGMTVNIDSDGDIYGRFEEKKTVSHQVAVGYRGSTMLNVPGWTLHSSADVLFMKKKVNDGWLRYQVDLLSLDDITPTNVSGWEMSPNYTDYAVNVGLHLADTVYKRASSRLVLGGGIRFKGEGEHFLHDEGTTDSDVPEIKLENVFVDQHATSFRYFVEPFVSGDWLSGRWSISGEYGLRLYHSATTDRTGHAVALYNMADKINPLSDQSFSHFTPLVTGRVKLAYSLSKHHRLSLTNSITNKLPTNSQTTLCFVQTTDYNKVFLGNPHLKPEINVQLALDHQLTYDHFSATTEVAIEQVSNQMAGNIYPCLLEGRHELVLMMQNVGCITTYKLSETLKWNSQHLQASAMLWGSLLHNKGVGSRFDNCKSDDNNWGWKLDAKLNLGCGWLIATNFQYTGGFKTITYHVSRMWQSSTVSIEKRIGPVTLYLNATSLVDPVVSFTNYDAQGNMIYLSEQLPNNRIVLLGCRWALTSK